LNYLLDVNLLIALVDASHVSHDAAHDWFAGEGRFHWATCPITENGLLRIIGNPKYPNSPGSPWEAMALLRKLVSLPGHEFWPDDATLRDDLLVDAAKILTPGQVTDSYLLALAASKSGQLATLDTRLSALAVRRGHKCLRLIKSKP
jgi:toxin-antitoxin system PIN domain toxin